MNHPTKAVAAGGFIFVKCHVYESVGGHASIPLSLIHDVSLARLVSPSDASGITIGRATPSSHQGKSPALYRLPCRKTYRLRVINLFLFFLIEEFPLDTIHDAKHQWGATSPPSTPDMHRKTRQSTPRPLWSAFPASREKYPHFTEYSSQTCVSAASASDSFNLLMKAFWYRRLRHASAIFRDTERLDSHT